MIGMVLVLLAAGPACVRFGIDSIAATKPQFGSRGWVVPAALQRFPSSAGIPADHLLREVRGAALRHAWRMLVWGAARRSCPRSRYSRARSFSGALRRGATGVSMVSNILVAHVFIGLWMLYLLVSHRWPELIAPDRRTQAPIGCGTTPRGSRSA